MSEEASRLLDVEIDTLVDVRYTEAKGIRFTSRRESETLEDVLLEEEIIDGERLSLVRRPRGRRAG